MSDESAPAIEPRVERLARELATVDGDCDPDMIAVAAFPGPMRLAGGFFAVPQHGQPLWTFFIPAARRAIAFVEAEAAADRLRPVCEVRRYRWPARDIFA